jgi:putative hemolysin
VADGRGRLEDEVWRDGVGRLVKWSRATVVPAFVDAQPSALFRLAGLLHPRLRTALLPRELLRLRQHRVAVRVGEPLESIQVAEAGPAASTYLRTRTYALEPRTAPGTLSTLGRRPADPIAPTLDRGALARDLETLPASCRLLAVGPYTVYCAAAPEMPSLLREIGRLRERTFRAAGEGTGRAADLDEYDRVYRHLFVWHSGHHALVGAYRIAATDQVCHRGNVSALYSHSLFRLAPNFLHAVGPALELGRSFVTPEYQREPGALLSLWKGIGALVAREPRYTTLFGPVSISADYSRVSRGVMHAFLESVGKDARLASLVRPRHPFRGGRAFQPLVTAGLVNSLDAVDRLVRQYENGRGVPVLLRQYWKLGASVRG